MIFLSLNIIFNIQFYQCYLYSFLTVLQPYQLLLQIASSLLCLQMSFNPRWT